MKGHPKPVPIGSKIARGTYRPDRDAYTVEIVASGDPPQMPEYLSPEAEAVWQQEVGRVMTAGGCEIDSSMLGRYCALEAMVRDAFAAGEPPPAAYLAELRRTAELFGIAGVKSRTIRPGSPQDNPFSRNGRRRGATPSGDK